MGKLAKWLRILGYDTCFFNGKNDSSMIAIALKEGRVILTRDTQVMKRRVITTGRLKAILIESDNLETQLRQVMNTLNPDSQAVPFTICPECNGRLEERSKEEIKDLVPPYVFKTQEQYMQCPSCHRIYWRGTHWQAMIRELKKLKEGA